MFSFLASSASKPLNRRHVLGALSGALGAAATLGAWSIPSQAYAQKRSRYPLQAGQYYWIPQIAPSGPVVTIVNLHTQMVQVFRNGVVIAFSSASTGKSGYGTPSGMFSVLEKRRHHRSSTYDNAPMPWMVRLTWSGVAFHAGRLPGYPASHGCIRLPHEFAPKFFDSVVRGDTVWITHTVLPEGTSPMTTLAPITPDGQPLLTAAAIEQAEYWNPALINATSHAEPLSVLVSLSQQRLYVLQQGQLLAAAALPAQAQTVTLDGGALFEWNTRDSTKTANTPTTEHWHPRDPNASQGGADLLQRVLLVNSPFARRLNSLLGDGSRLFISHLPAVNDMHWEVMH